MAPIELWYWPTSNGFKIAIAMEEMELDYTLVPINIGAGEQFREDFLAITPNHRIPAIVDPDGPGGRYTLFESGAILLYLANKTGKFLPADDAGKFRAIEWLMFQMGGIGPMFGQANHFRAYAPEKIPYAIERYTNEVRRLYGVLEKRLSQASYLAGEEFTIADMAAFPWARNFERYDVDLADFPSVGRWVEAVGARPGVQRGMQVLADRRRQGAITDAERENMFGATQYQRR